MKRICFVVSDDYVAKWFLLNHFKELVMEFEVNLVTNTENPNFLKNLGIPITVYPVPIFREIFISRDFKVLLKMVRIFSKNKFDLLHSVTPKAGLLSILAGFLSGIPIRIHTFTGQIWVARTGLLRLILRFAEKAISFFCTNVLVDSYSQMEFLVSQGQIPDWKPRVLGNGSICGVDTDRFCFDPLARKSIRCQEKIFEEDLAFIFVGRLTKDKGLLDLAVAFSQLSENCNNIHLLIVGPDEQNIRERIFQLCSSTKGNVHFSGFTDFPEKYLSASDVLCLPSYREGFGSVIIEAASVGLPAIASRIYGLTDAVVENQTGLFHKPGDVEEIKEKMFFFIKNPHERLRMGENAKKRAWELFSKQVVTKSLISYYRECFNQK